MHHRNRNRLAGSLLLLAAPLAISAGEDWSCAGGAGADGWICTGQGKKTVKAPIARRAVHASTNRPAKSLAAATYSRSASPGPAEPTPGLRTAVGYQSETREASTDEVATSEQPEQTAKGAAGTVSSRRNPDTGSAPADTVAAENANPQKATKAAAEPAASREAMAPADVKADVVVAGSGTGTTRSAPKAAGAASGTDATRTPDTSVLHEGLDWEYCGLRPARLGPAALPPQPSAEDRLFVGADTFDYDRELQLLWLSGDVQMAQGSRFVKADKIVYDRDSADLVAKGNIFLANPGARLVADEAQLNLESDRGNLSDVHYRLTGKINARGSADEAELVEPTLTRYRDIVYTACRPDQNAWSLQAAELELDQDEGVGVARNAKLRVRGVPVLYSPYLSFPIDDRRKSGILVPTLGNSDNNGIDLTVPYYWNIAPNMDATISPRVMSKRGLMLGTEFRYLSARQNAVLYGEIIPEDSGFQGASPRWGYRIEQEGRFGNRWSSTVNFNAVSDDEYLEDFGNQLEVTSTRNIERRGDLAYRGDGWFLLTRLQDYQTVDASLPSESYPYARLPQLLFSATPYKLDSGIELGVGGDYNYFLHDTKVDGHRVALQPYARWPMRKSYGHLIPELDLHLATYDLQDQDLDKDASPSYVIPSFNLDAELVFERTINWFDRESLQTLEPRLYYLYTPFQDQDDIPVFDSAELSFSYYSLFRQNRFSGRDRIGDANQLTIGLTSRTLAKESGHELLRASIGQTLYFRDRDVQIVGSPQDERSSSIAGLLSARLLQDWTGRASFEYDPNRTSERSQKRSLELHYQTQDDRLLNLAYRFDLGKSEATKYEDTDLSFRLPVNPSLQLVGRWSYSLLNSETVEAFAGVEYGQCCWRMRLLGRHLKNKPGSAGTNSFMVQVELAGLGSIGQQVDKFLERGIYGYHAD